MQGSLSRAAVVLCPPGSAQSSRSDLLPRLPGKIPISLPTYLPIYLSTHLPTYLRTGREDLIPIHLSIYYFLLFLFWENGGKDTYELDKAYSFDGYGATVAAMSCYLHGRTFLFTPAFSVVFIYLGGTYEYPAPINTLLHPDFTGEAILP